MICLLGLSMILSFLEFNGVTQLEVKLIKNKNVNLLVGLIYDLFCRNKNTT
ncbi:MAG: hypothetical protein GAK29_01204 [Acinetobacter bereziniae]|uniref:Uncharacterized protein n=1 Tax=Acinetobacter bereziniae TaxID=106648 RepID=A0A833PH16_ACIBZ|nr:MAG: hypothetical protein GAK29_01204 [Acinetobacter bereziniae]